MIQWHFDANDKICFLVFGCFLRDPRYICVFLTQFQSFSFSFAVNHDMHLWLRECCIFDIVNVKPSLSNCIGVPLVRVLKEKRVKEKEKQVGWSFFHWPIAPQKSAHRKKIYLRVHKTVRAGATKTEPFSLLSANNTTMEISISNRTYYNLIQFNSKLILYVMVHAQIKHLLFITYSLDMYSIYCRFNKWWNCLKIVLQICKFTYSTVDNQIKNIFW